MGDMVVRNFHFFHYLFIFFFDAHLIYKWVLLIMYSLFDNCCIFVYVFSFCFNSFILFFFLVHFPLFIFRFPIYVLIRFSLYQIFVINLRFLLYFFLYFAFIIIIFTVTTLTRCYFSNIIVILFELF